MYIAIAELAAPPGPSALRSLPSLVSLVRADREQHVLTHLPYQHWCSACVKGRGRNDHHRRPHTDAEGLPVIAFDYGFRRETGAFRDR